MRNQLAFIQPSTYSQIITPRKAVMKKIVSSLSVLALATVALAGCSSDGSPTTEGSKPASEAPAPKAECLDVPTELQETITSEYSGVAMSPVKASAVKSDLYPSAYLVALEFSASGGDNEVGIWSTSELAGGAPIFAVDGMAKSFTNWKPAADSVIPFDSTSEGVDDAKACVTK